MITVPLPTPILEGDRWKNIVKYYARELNQEVVFRDDCVEFRNMYLIT